ncbi:PTS sugar transporter subunit IIB [Sporolactobacillus shoreicorticis]|uniref:PTS system mannose/fructose/N-acetylgalactosamine-transporter subunit IIB n=1 Tax=Sporolactobacillus shoreicorticis TaxID=1923877 RepID=A0ABW5S2A5_9BACL|nr:PTS sugar transporter subunit IIB [Sporolactobacillus shoreicorticis]MCO7124679.1 PTS sugar transporter subunit IIB [Sporolactobacillus shoreicorticis]
MIKMVRIDERLIHGQVALIWTKALGVDRIIVVNEEAAKNPMMVSTLKLATPDNVKCIVLGREAGGELLNNPRADALKILVVVNNPEDANYLCQHVKTIPFINVGNYGKADGKTSEKEKWTDNLFVSEKDKNEFRSIIKKGIDVIYQLVPDQSKKNLKDLIS